MNLPHIDYEKIILEKLKIEIAESFPAYISANLTVEQVYRELASQMVYHLHSFIWARKIKNETITSSENVPVDWLEHLKERFAPKWFLKKHPVKYRRIATVKNYNVYHTCPHINYPVDDRQHMEFLMGKLSFENEFMEKIEQ